MPLSSTQYDRTLPYYESSSAYPNTKHAHLLLHTLRYLAKERESDIQRDICLIPLLSSSLQHLVLLAANLQLVPSSTSSTSASPSTSTTIINISPASCRYMARLRSTTNEAALASRPTRPAASSALLPSETSRPRPHARYQPPRSVPPHIHTTLPHRERPPHVMDELIPAARGACRSGLRQDLARCWSASTSGSIPRRRPAPIEASASWPSSKIVPPSRSSIFRTLLSIAKRRPRVVAR